MLIDSWGREITYLRVSVTDRCNLRCVYCMPAEGVVWQPHETILTYEEIAAVVREAAANGIRAVRLTGGEPLVRKNLPDLVRMIAAIPGIEDISLTSNGLMLEKMAGALVDAGLRRINLSLDTLKPDKFARITRGGNFEQVWRGILAAEAHGLNPIKINTVAMRGVNEDELADIAKLSVDHPWHMRFIELMPVKNQISWGVDYLSPEKIYLPFQKILDALEPLGLQPLTSKNGCGPAKEYVLPGAKGKIGIITPLGEKFCDACNRLRLTADGHLRPCLLVDDEINVREALRSGQPILPLLQKAVAVKPKGHELSEQHYPQNRCMQQVGG